ncbi:MAG: hypothetical protein RR655_07665, partial [Raoultibacter sp.]
QPMTCGIPAPLSANAYTLAGWRFDGWNDKPDGTGTSYADAAEVSDLSLEDAAVVTLYAQWTAKPYTVKFAPGELATQP